MQGEITIVVVGYNRGDAIERVLHSLARAQYDYTDIRLVVSIDCSGKEDAARAAERFCWEHGEYQVIRHPKRLGLRNHIISCGDLTGKYGAVMVLEDDLYVSPDFYNYAMSVLKKYGDLPQIAGISLNTKRELLESAYPFLPLRKGDDIYFQQFATSWGQVWNKRMWNGFREWYDCHPTLPDHKDVLPEVLRYPDTSWAKYYQTYIVDTGKYFVYSYDSLTTNFGDAGQHFGSSSSAVQSVLFYGKKNYRMPDFEDGIKYDIYGEPVGLGKALGVEEAELTCDMWGRKREESFRRYVLSSRKLPYQAVKSFGMQMKPMELNILEGIPGKELCLYDTQAPEERGGQEKEEVHIRLLEYGYGVLDGRDLMSWGLKRLRSKLAGKRRKNRKKQ